MAILILKHDSVAGVRLAGPLLAEDLPEPVSLSFTNQSELTIHHTFGQFPHVQVVSGSGPYFEMPPTAIRAIEYGVGFVRVAFSSPRTGLVRVRP